MKRRESEPFFAGRYGLYGLRNFGDNFGSDGMNWDNLEYDMTHACLVQFLRTGDLRVLKAARECHLHNREVDCLTIRPGFESLCHHTGDHNQKPAGLGHMWCEGAWEYYFLTGDRRSAAQGDRDQQRFRSLCRQTAGRRGARGRGARDYGWSVVGLTAAYRATADPFYLNAAREIEEVVVRTQDPFRGGWINRLSTGHCFHAPAHSGRVYFMHDIVLDGQVLFHQLTGDPDVEKCIVCGLPRHSRRGRPAASTRSARPRLHELSFSALPRPLVSRPGETQLQRPHELCGHLLCRQPGGGPGPCTPDLRRVDQGERALVGIVFGPGKDVRSGHALGAVGHGLHRQAAPQRKGNREALNQKRLPNIGAQQFTAKVTGPSTAVGRRDLRLRGFECPHFQEPLEAGLVQMAAIHQVCPNRDGICFTCRLLVPVRRHQHTGFRFRMLEYEAVRLDTLACLETQIE